MKRSLLRSRGPSTWKGWLLLLLLVAAAARVLFPPVGPGLQGRVVAVADGDTLTVLVDRRQVRVRLHGIDCPERGQAFATAARRFAGDRAFGRDVRVLLRDRDRYGRVVGVVLVEGESLNEALVETGLAWAYRRYSEEYVGAEERARAARRGLWGDREPVPPWEYRSRRRQGRPAGSAAREEGSGSR